MWSHLESHTCRHRASKRPLYEKKMPAWVPTVGCEDCEVLLMFPADVCRVMKEIMFVVSQGSELARLDHRVASQLEAPQGN